MQVRRIAAEDVEAHRAIRAEMLADAPAAFIETSGQFAARRRADVAERVRQRATSPDSAQFVAFARGACIGSSIVARTPDRPAEAGLFGVYVTPAYRGTGVVDALVAACLDWARAAGCTEARLEVVTGNDRARRVYERHGFVPAEVLPHPTAPGATELRLRRRLD